MLMQRSNEDAPAPEDPGSGRVRRNTTSAPAIQAGKHVVLVRAYKPVEPQKTVALPALPLTGTVCSISERRRQSFTAEMAASRANAAKSRSTRSGVARRRFPVIWKRLVSRQAGGSTGGNRGALKELTNGMVRATKAS